MLPIEFGKTIQEFKDEWCVGVALGYSDDEVMEALAALKRHFPKKVSDAVNMTGRGISLAAPLIQLGRMLLTSENKLGFAKVLARLLIEDGYKSAYSELILVDLLERAGFATDLEPPILGKVLDAVATVQGKKVFIEVIAPEVSDKGQEKSKLVAILHDKLKVFTELNIEIGLEDGFEKEEIEPLVQAIRDMESARWVECKGVGRFRTFLRGATLPEDFGHGENSYNVGIHIDPSGARTTKIVWFETDDQRAQRILRHEYEQLPANESNIIFVYSAHIGATTGDWENHVVRMFQPSRNRKIGAVVLWHQSVGSTRKVMEVSSKILVNPHAQVQVPGEILDVFKKDYQTLNQG